MFILILCSMKSTPKKKSEIPKTDTSKKSSSNVTRNTLIAGLAVLAMFFVIALGVIGFIGYRFLNDYAQTENIVTTINDLNDQYQPIEDEYNQLLFYIDQYDSTQYSDALSEQINDSLDIIDTDLENFNNELDSVTRDDLDGYVQALQTYSNSMSELNGDIRILVSYSQCYSQWSTVTSEVGNRASAEAADDYTAGLEIYNDLYSATNQLRECLSGVESISQELLSVVDRVLNSNQIIITGLENNSVSEEELDEFIAASQSLQEQSIGYAEEIILVLEEDIADVESSLTAIEAEQNLLSQEYDIQFEEE